MARVASFEYGRRRVLPTRVRILHWLIVLGTCVASIAITLPSVLSQQPVYASSTLVQFDPAVFGHLLNGEQPSDALTAQQQYMGGQLLATYPSLAQRGLRYEYPVPGQIRITAYALDPTLTSDIARDAGTNMVRHIYASMGMPLLRTLVGYELYAALQGRPAGDESAQLLRNLVQTQAIAGVTPADTSRSLSALTPAELHAVTRALEVLATDTTLNVRRAEQALQAANDAGRAQAQEQLRGATTSLQAVRGLLNYLYTTYNTRGDINPQPLAFVAQGATAATALPRYSALKLAIAAGVGLLGGALTVLVDRQVGIFLKLQELWQYRALIRNMVARDLKARYKNSLLGYVWSLLNPLLMMCVFWVVFSLLLKNAIPMFPVFLIVALLPWNYAVTSVSSGMRAILDNSNIVKKVYFPREILPITVVLSNLVNYLFALPVMFLVMAGVQLLTIHQLNFSWTFAFLPVILIIQTIFLIGMALLLSTTAVFFRDTTHIIDILIQLWLFLTPVFFALDNIVSPTAAKMVRWLNPMASIIDFYRDILYGQANPGTIPTPGLPALDGVFRTLLTALVVLALGAYVFHRTSGRFGEEI
jgi:lipopolysaccharide transport system permease protein